MPMNQAMRYSSGNSEGFSAGNIASRKLRGNIDMNWDIFKENWKLFKDKVKAQWGKLTGALAFS
jgi:hypothetical protein